MSDSTITIKAQELDVRVGNLRIVSCPQLAPFSRLTEIYLDNKPLKRVTRLVLTLDVNSLPMAEIHLIPEDDR